MTVRRHLDGHFNLPLAALADAVRAVLSRNTFYGSTIEVKPGKIFTTLVRSGKWLPGAAMTISLESVDNGTKIYFKTISRWFVFQDILNHCNQHIWRTLRDLRREVRNKRPVD